MQINRVVIKHNDAELPFERRCVVKFHREDGGVVNRIQLVIDDELINRTSCASLSQPCMLCQGVYIAVVSQFSVVHLPQ
jgi:hypothetical protein